MITPFFSGFPGLAPACAQPLSPAQVREALSCVPPSRPGLAAAVLRSWEDRFGARLIAVGHDEFKLLTERLPRSRDAA